MFINSKNKVFCYCNNNLVFPLLDLCFVNKGNSKLQQIVMCYADLLCVVIVNLLCQQILISTNNKVICCCNKNVFSLLDLCYVNKGNLYCNNQFCVILTYYVLLTKIVTLTILITKYFVNATKFYSISTCYVNKSDVLMQQIVVCYCDITVC